MKYVLRTSKDIKENALEELLIDRGILQNKIYNDSYFNPTFSNEQSFEDFDNLEEGYQVLIYTIINNGKIYIPVDSDVDGYTSAAVTYLYLMENFKEKLGYDFSIDYHIPEGKEHGLRTLMDIFTDEKKYDLIILPDSSSNDYEEHRILKEMGYNILILDHHNADKYSEDAIVINNQLSNYKNKNLSGVGVVYKFLEYVTERVFEDKGIELENPIKYLDLVALGMISDMMVMQDLESRWICDYGLSHIENGFFKELIKKQAYSIFGINPDEWNDDYYTNGELTQINVAFYITPLINSLIRVGNSSEKERLFISFINPYLEVDSTKRGEKGQKETISVQVVRNCVNAKNKQNKEKERAIELFDMQIIENCLNENKILILNADDLDIPNTLTGLCAMGVAAKYKKPVILGRTSPDGFLKGSIRGQGESELKDFQSFLLESNLVDYVQG